MNRDDTSAANADICLWVLDACADNNISLCQAACVDGLDWDYRAAHKHEATDVSRGIEHLLNLSLLSLHTGDETDSHAIKTDAVHACDSGRVLHWLGITHKGLKVWERFADPKYDWYVESLFIDKGSQAISLDAAETEMLRYSSIDEQHLLLTIWRDTIHTTRPLVSLVRDESATSLTPVNGVVLDNAVSYLAVFGVGTGLCAPDEWLDSWKFRLAWKKRGFRPVECENILTCDNARSGKAVPQLCLDDFL